MHNPISNFELGKRLHQEYEAAASRNWDQAATTGEEKSRSTKVARLAVVLGGVSVTIVLFVQLLPL